MTKILFIAAFLSVVYIATAQNSSPYWSLAGNSNATSTSKLGTTNAINLRLITNNSERMRITTSGNVGIGTTSPLTKFQVNGFGAFGNSITAGNAVRALNLADVNAVMRVLRVDPSNAPAVELISRQSPDGANVAYWDFYAQPSDASFRIRDRQSGGSGLDRITIAHGSGNVGIGTTSPGYKLHVQSTGNAVYGNSTSGGIGVYGNSTYLGVYGTGSDYGVYGTASAATGEGVFGAGYYGVYGNGSQYGVYGKSNSAFALYGVSGSSTAIYGEGYFGIYGRGNSTGIYGVGSSYGIDGFSSSGNGVHGYSSSAAAVYGTSYTGTGGYFSSTSSNGIWAITSSTVSNVYAGVFQGNVYSYGTFQTSDKNLKKNIEDMSDAMSIINKLKPKNYMFRNDGKYAALHLPSGSHYGLLAQDLEQVLPGLVRDAPLLSDKNANNVIKKEAVNPATTGASATTAVSQHAMDTIITKAVNYTELIPIVIKGMQEQSVKIQQQQTEISDLKNEINELKSLISQAGNGATRPLGYLKQNAPNPAGDNTVISYFSPANAGNAQILVSDMKGSVLRAYNVSKGEGQLSIKRGELPAGTYTYTLYINNSKIDTKQMIITR